MRFAAVVFALAALALGSSGCCSTAACQPESLPDGGRVDTPETFVRTYRYLFENECWSQAYDLLSPRTRDEFSYVAFYVKVPSYRVPLPGAEDTAEPDLPLRCIIEGIEYIEAYEDAPDPGQAIVVGSWRGYQVTVILVAEPVEPGRNEWRLGMLEMTEQPGWVILAQVQHDASGGQKADHDCEHD